MKVAILTLFLGLMMSYAKAQDCDIATLGVTHTASPATGGCVGQSYNFKFSIANLGTSPGCTIPANSVQAIFDFPTLAGGVKPYLYNGPASFVSGYFSWQYNSTFEVLIGTNILAIPNGEGDADVLVPVIGNMPGAGNSTLNLTQSGATSNNTSNDFSKAQLVISALPVVTCPAASSVCLAAPAFTLTGGSPSGGVYAGPGVTSGQFNPASAGVGAHTITYTYTNVSGCTNSCSFTINVNAAPVVTCPGNSAVCVNAPAFALSGQSPAGGVFSGPGVSAGQFNPATAGVGVHTITYNYSDGNGCSNSCSFQLTVNALPVVSFSGLAASYCINAAAATLTGSPAGGTFSGTGISGNQFNPATAGVGGPYSITYSYTDPTTGCGNSSVQTVTVNALPVVSFSGLSASYCINAGAVTLVGSPAGGTFSGNGISGNQFNPATAGVGGPYSITYSYTNPSTGCSNTSSQTVSVNALPVVSFSGLSASYCVNEGAATLLGSPAGGTFSGSGISGNQFNPATAGAGGPYTITYSYTDLSTGCSNSSSQTVTVNALPVVSFTGLAANYCTTDAAVTLTGSPTGGTFSGPGTSGNSFDPAVAGAGTHTITYNYTNPTTGCSNSSSQTVTVSVCATNITVNMKLFLQGYYAGGGTMQPVLNNQAVAGSLPNETDTITVELHDPVTFAFIASEKAVLQTNGLVAVTFTQPAGPYYLAIRHRNTLQTWTANPVVCAVATPLYDFSTAANTAFADNQVEVSPGVWAFYTGDIDQDEFIDGNDFPYYDMDSSNGVAFEYKATDLNGDGFVDGNDFPVYDGNSSVGASSIHP